MARAGYNYGNNPVPKDTLSPIFATIIKDHVTVGLDYTPGRLGIDLNYIYGLPTRVSYTRPDGLFQQAFECATLQALEVMLQYRFGHGAPSAEVLQRHQGTW